MCRSIAETGRRCAAHSPENRAAERAQVRLDFTFEDHLERLQAETASLREVVAGGEPTAIGAAVAAWLKAWRELMAAMAKAYTRARAKAERAATVLGEHQAERLQRILDGERREFAEKAVKAHADAVVALRRAEQRRRELLIQVEMDAAAQDLGTQHDLAKMALEEAVQQLTLMHAESERLRRIILPADETTASSGPRRGLPGPTMLAFLEAKRREDFWAGQHTQLTRKLRETPSKEATLRMLAAVTEACEAGRQYVAACAETKEGLLNIGRPRSTATESELLAA
ncbi:hypothetical protein [Arthrobacter sp. STN4]|uniref:hypothetical protein n=1 Tax=Arthrobacter sp. STN4 TaxID=2923276 RepID=UPI00211A45FD|nr:hypothetical protein [Arthrobacter sp. STN4]MCQ9162933.1 hypothetical protein [Arthrobacter sp. STN4]